MSNMSYCRFRNTLGDLRDCLDAEREGEPGQEEFLKDLGEDEADARRRLLDAMAEYLSDLGWTVSSPVEG